MTKEITEEVFFGRERFVRWRDDEGDIPRGSVQLPDGRLLYGYPRIGRILHLAQGLRAHFGEEPFWAEEKVDGYNVRVIRWQGKLLAFTRGGFPCPYTTDRVRRWLPDAPFREDPELVLCLEVAGPETPYTDASPPFVRADAKPFAFDAMRIGRPGFVSRTAFYAMMERYAIPSVQRLGRFCAQDAKALHAILARYEQEGREGIVFKDETGARMVKYTPAATALRDLEVGAPDLAELPAEYFTNRLLRLALALAEAERAPELYAEALGKTLLLPLAAEIRAFLRTGRLRRTRRCRTHTKRAALALLRHLRHVAHGRHIRKISLTRGEDGLWHLVFAHEPASLSGLLHHLFSGGAILD